MEKTQTAVEWLFQQLWNEPKDKFTWYALKEKAIQMEKEQIIIAYQSERYPCSDSDAEQYYNETYKNK
jgi:hypothetical protein